MHRRILLLKLGQLFLLCRALRLDGGRLVATP